MWRCWDSWIGWGITTSSRKAIMCPCSYWLYSTSGYFSAFTIWYCAPCNDVSSSVAWFVRHASSGYNRRRWEGCGMPWRNMRRLISLWIVVLLLIGWSGATVSHDDPTSSTSQPTPPEPQEVGARLVGPVVYTIDARSRDVWMYFNFARGSVVTVQDPKTEAWDLMFQRYIMKTNGGETNPTAQGALLSMKERDFTAV